jgi:Leucine-rich repeat (LRR) protein
LEVLDISGIGQFSLPASASTLPRLRSLSVSNCDSIPYIPSLRRLEYVYWGDSLGLPAGLEQYSSLASFTLTSNCRWYDAKELASKLAQMKQLSSLSIDNPYGQDASPIIESVQRLPALRKLKLQDLYASSGSIAGLKNLSSLEIKGLQCMDDSTGKKCYEAISRLPSLEDFMVEFIPQDVAQYSLPKSISFQFSNWYQEEPRANLDFASIAHLPNVHRLRVQMFASKIGTIQSLRELDLQEARNLSGRRDLAQAISGLKNLRRLCLQAETLRALGQDIQGFTQLTEIYVNSLREDFTPDEIAQAKAYLPNCTLSFAKED